MRKRLTLLTVIAVGISAGLSAQTRNNYLAVKVTGQLALTNTFNPLLGAARLFGAQFDTVPRPEISKVLTKFPHPTQPRLLGAFRSFASPQIQSVPVINSGIFGFDGLTHADQRQANSGNQFSVEPPNPSIAVANNFILEGVNNAVRVYSTAGTPLTRTISSNELFVLPPAINRTTGVNGVFPTDMRVYFDQDVNRWFVLQRAQDNDASGNPIASSHLYLAVSQTTDPTGLYNIYVMNTTDTGNTACPCVWDYPQIGSDQYGFYISANEYDTSAYPTFVQATILAISKTALASGVSAPPAYRFLVPRSTGFEFAIQPATTPPAASHYLANGGVEYFVSSQSSLSTDNNLAIWAMSNTASLQNATASLLLTQTTVGTLTYNYPDVAIQKNGPLPYGSSIGAGLAPLDGGLDSRVLSVSYSGGRLFATMATQLINELGRSVVGGAYVIMSPTIRSGIVAGSVLKQGYLLANNNNHILRPAVAVNAQGRGAIAFTLVGPDYFPSAAFVNIDTSANVPSVIQIANLGSAPEDGFTGYSGNGPARWGDYATAVTGTDGSIWMTSEYIPNLPRTTLANWGTFLYHLVP